VEAREGDGDLGSGSIEPSFKDTGWPETAQGVAMSVTLPFDREALETSIRPPGRTLPAAAYVDPAVLAWERRAFLEGSWYCLGRSGDLPREGDRRAYPVGSEAVLVVRGGDGMLRGFFNTCRHRGHELVACGGTVEGGRAIVCPYHSWAYGLDGRFRGAPKLRDRCDWKRDDPANSLVSVRLEEWGGWTFVNCSGDAPSLLEHLGNVVETLEPYDLDRLVVADSHDYEIAANWKLVCENYHECYHCSTIHPELCEVTPPDSGVAFEPTGLVVGGSMDLKEHAETMSLDGRSGGVAFAGLDPVGRRQVLYLHLFPNLLVSAHPDYVMTHRLEPVDEGRTRVECEWLFPPQAVQRPDFDPSYAVEFWDVTNKQDWSACEGVQRGVGGRGYRQGPLSDAEANVWQFIALVAQSYLAGRPTGPVPHWQPVS
jgi:Rieske 2Fe-2S family protein